MSIVLECMSGAHKGRRLLMTPGKPLVFKLKKHDLPAGHVAIELTDQGSVMTNRSEIPCRVNGLERPRCALRHGDEMVIGKDTFRLIDESDTMATQSMTPIIIDQAPKLLRCSSCGAIFNPQKGWTDGTLRLCRSCVEKGVKPASLRRPAEPPPRVVGVDTEDLESDVAPAVPPPKPLQRPPAKSPPSQPRERTPVPAQDDERHLKRISASRLALVEPQPSTGNGLFRKMSNLLGGGRAERQRLEQLESERQMLLVEAGRLSLGRGGGLGIGEASVMALAAGKVATIRPEELDGAVFDKWKSLRERAKILDTEISALRRVLDLGPDTEALLLPAPVLRPQIKAQQEQAFANLDGYRTENLDDQDLPALDSPKIPTPVPARSLSSGRNRAARRKR